MGITTRQQAKLTGAKTYFTGNACPAGHVSPRRTDSGTCGECGRALARERRRATYAADKEKVLSQNAAYRLANPEKITALKRQWQKANPDKVYESSKRQRLADPERNIAYKAKYRDANRDALNEKMRSRKKANRPYYAAISNKRHAAKLRAIPAWADFDLIEAFYHEAKRLEEADGIKRHVDHIVPLRGKNVCGFHSQDNLQILTAVENLKKLNKYDDNAA